MSMQKLRTLIIAAYSKLHANRNKKGVWPATAYDKNNCRIWQRPGMTQDFLVKKLDEELAGYKRGMEQGIEGAV